ncbi:hypothetical protein VTN00DRAFT_5383 [Thermoascus crustaceus]|uniref:uncharacterized protein n=1 Tax=Thermoascus crustaceus TaxID=5088 RepID=UPI003742E2F3
MLSRPRSWLHRCAGLRVSIDYGGRHRPSASGIRSSADDERKALISPPFSLQQVLRPLQAACENQFLDFARNRLPGGFALFFKLFPAATGSASNRPRSSSASCSFRFRSIYLIFC